MTDNESQDSTDDTFYLVNVDPKMKTTNQYENIMQEVIKESQEDRNKTPTVETFTEDINYGSSINGHYVCLDVKYVGCATIQKSNDSLEVNRCISELSKQPESHQTSIKLLIPIFNINSVKMLDASTNDLIIEFPICKIGFCTSGYKNHFDKYFAFSFLKTNTSPSPPGPSPSPSTFSMSSPSQSSLVSSVSSSSTTQSILQCFVFLLRTPFYTDRLLECFKKSFDSSLTPNSAQLNSIKSFARTVNVQFKLTIDIKEDDGKGYFQSVPKEDSQLFKLRSNVHKKVIIKLEQLSGPMIVKVERCVGLFIGAGRYLSDVDMTLLEMESLGEINNKTNGFSVSGEWDPSSNGFELLNNMREKDQTIYMTIGINVCINDIAAPICLKVACKAKIFPENHRFWINLRKPTILHLMLSLEESIEDEENQIIIDRYVTKTIQYIWPDNIITVNCQPNTETSNYDSNESDLEEPVKSGSGMVSKDIPADDQLMARWANILMEWQSDVNTRPKGAVQMIYHGVPEALRGEVWQLLAGSVAKENELQDVYRILMTKETKFDAVIKRDMPRTFTAHPMFLDKDGPGQESLFRVCKAYASYDEEVGYCQGSAFLSAALIIHMPEEQAFALLVAIMNKYQIRNMYSKNFEGLHICLYQLDNLMLQNMNDLYLHFSEMQLESHMYANQWFMTLFTMKFHLYAVFHILDLFLSDGIIVIFKVALALLKLSKKELLMMDFEGALNYFRTSLPKLYRNEEACKELIKAALNIKVSKKKLSNLEKEWRKIQEVRAETEDPLETVQKELKHTKDEYNRLDQENDSLAKELISSKINLQRNIDKLEENLDTVKKELFSTRQELVESQDHNQRLQEEVKQVKDRFREEMQIRETKMRQQDNIIFEYKRIVSQLNYRMEVNEKALLEHQEDGRILLDNGVTNQMSSEESMKELKKLTTHLIEVMEKCDNCKQQVLTTADTVTVSPDGDEKCSSVCDTDTPVADREIICISKSLYKKQKDKICETELTLANTKLSLVESHCQQQKLSHEVTVLHTMLEEKQRQYEELSAGRSGGSSLMKKLLSRTVSSSYYNTDNSNASNRHSICFDATTHSITTTTPSIGMTSSLYSDPTNIGGGTAAVAAAYQSQVNATTNTNTNSQTSKINY